MTMYDYVCLYTTMYDCVWLCMMMYGYVWLCMSLYYFIWLCITLYDYVWICMTMPLFQFSWMFKLCLTLINSRSYAQILCLFPCNYQSKVELEACLRMSPLRRECVPWLCLIELLESWSHGEPHWLSNLLFDIFYLLKLMFFTCLCIEDDVFTEDDIFTCGCWWIILSLNPCLGCTLPSLIGLMHGTVW